MNLRAPGHRPDVGTLPEFFAKKYAGVTRATRFLAGLCLMMPREVLDQVGRLEEIALGSRPLNREKGEGGRAYFL